LIRIFAKRLNDEVIPLLADMSPPVFLEHYVFHFADAFSEELQLKRQEKSVIDFLDALNMSILFGVDEVRQIDRKTGRSRRTQVDRILIICDSDLYVFTRVIERLARREKSKPMTTFKEQYKEQSRRDRAATLNILKLLKLAPGSRVIIGSKYGQFVYSAKFAKQEFDNLMHGITKSSEQLKQKLDQYDSIPVTDEMKQFLINSHVYQYVYNQIVASAEYIEEQKSKFLGTQELINELLSEES